MHDITQEKGKGFFKMRFKKIEKQDTQIIFLIFLLLVLLLL